MRELCTVSPCWPIIHPWPAALAVKSRVWRRSLLTCEMYMLLCTNSARLFISPVSEGFSLPTKTALSLTNRQRQTFLYEYDELVKILKVHKLTKRSIRSLLPRNNRKQPSWLDQDHPLKSHLRSARTEIKLDPLVGRWDTSFFSLLIVPWSRDRRWSDCQDFVCFHLY